MRTLTLIIALAGTLWLASAVTAQESSSSNVNTISGYSRQEIKSMNILDRPYYRPGHFYGNTVRRRYYSGRSLLYGRRGR